MLLTLASIWLVLVTTVSAQLKQDVKDTGKVDNSELLWEKISDQNYLDQLQKELMMPNMDISAIFQGFFHQKGQDQQIEFSFNPVRVKEIMECPTEMADEKVILDQAHLGDALLQAYIGQQTDNSRAHNNYFFGIGEDAAALMVVDELLSDDIEIQPMMMTLGFFEGDDFEGDLDDDVVVEFVISAPNQDTRHPFIGVRQQVLHDGMSDSANFVSKLDDSPIDPDWPLGSQLPTFVTHMHAENSESAVVMVGTSKLNEEPWFPKLPPFYQFLLSQLHERDSVVVQMHEYTRVSYLLPYCQFSGRWYKFGQQIPIGLVCRICMCGPEFQGHGTDSCYHEPCLWSRFVASYTAEGCRPEYVYGECCPNIVCPGGKTIPDAGYKYFDRKHLFEEPDYEKKRVEYDRRKNYEFRVKMFPDGY